MPYNNKHIGELSEAAVLLDLIRNGYWVSRPWGDNQRYDFILDDGTRLFRAQVKTGRRTKSGSLTFASSSANKDGGRSTYVGEVDIFLVWDPETRRTYWVPIEEAAQARTTLKFGSLSYRLQPNRVPSKELASIVNTLEED